MKVIFLEAIVLKFMRQLSSVARVVHLKVVRLKGRHISVVVILHQILLLYDSTN